MGISLIIYTVDEEDKATAVQEFDDVVSGITSRLNEFDKSEDGSLINKATDNMEHQNLQTAKVREEAIRQELNDMINQLKLSQAQDIYDDAIQRRDGLKKFRKFPLNGKSKCESIHSTRMRFNKVIAITENLENKKAKELNKKCQDQIEEFVKEYPKCQ